MISQAERWAPRTSKTETLEFVVKQPPKPLSFLGTNYADTLHALLTTFGNLPIQLNKFEHEQMLIAMAAAAGPGGTPYKQLLEAVQAYGEIEVRTAG